MEYGSVCSGIEAASIAWEPLGWKPAWFAEIDKFPSAVLAHHWPDVVNHGDMTIIKDLVAMGLTDAPDVLVGGTPCQAFSVAGARKSLDDDRGQLTLEYVRLLNQIDEVRNEEGKPPAICVWENVPGVLNTKDNAFGCLLGALSGEDDPLQPPGGRWTDCGFVLGPQRAVAWRVLDAQYFGLAQRRRRVFVISSAGDLDPREILFDTEGVRRDFRPSRQAQEGHALASKDGFNYGDLEAVVAMASGQAADAGIEQELCPTLTCIHEAPLVAGTLDTRSGEACEQTMSQGNYVVDIPVGVFQQSSMQGRGTVGWDESGVSKPVKPQSDHQMVVTTATHDKATLTAGDRHMVYTAEVSPHISTGAPFSKPGNERVELDAMVVLDWRVRRLLPVECCRLQGFPDSHQYKAYGNSMAVAVMEWLGKRIDTHLKEVGLC